MAEDITPYQVAPKTPLAGSAAGDIREQGELTRRTFPFVLTSAWLLLTAAVGGLAGILGRFLFPNVLFEPVSKFKAGFLNDYSVGEVDERWKDKYGIWLVRTEEVMYALITVCTHLGCTPNWLPSQNKFKCPCHGSGYYKSGVNFEGPAPRYQFVRSGSHERRRGKRSRLALTLSICRIKWGGDFTTPDWPFHPTAPDERTVG